MHHYIIKYENYIRFRVPNFNCPIMESNSFWKQVRVFVNILNSLFPWNIIGFVAIFICSNMKFHNNKDARIRTDSEVFFQKNKLIKKLGLPCKYILR